MKHFTDSDVEKEIPPKLGQGVAQNGKPPISAPSKPEPETPSESMQSELVSDKQGRQQQTNQNNQQSAPQNSNTPTAQVTKNKPIAKVEPLSHQRDMAAAAAASPPDSPQQDETSQPAEQPSKPKFDLVAELRRGCLLT